MTNRLSPWDAPHAHGDPWHGLWEDGTLTLPSGGIRGMTLSSDGGDAYEVRNSVSVTTTPTTDETNDGKTWLPYGLLASRGHFIHGESISDASWIYCASDGTVWEVTITYSPASPTATISFSRYGFLDDAVVQTVSVSVPTSMAGSAYWIDDITADGSRAAIVTGNSAYYSSSYITTYNERVLRGGFVVEISGVPSSEDTATVSIMTLFTDEDSYGEYVDTVVRTTSTIGSVSYTATASGEWGTVDLPHGVMFGDSGDAVIVYLSFLNTTDSAVTSPVSGGAGYIFTGSSSGSCELRLYAGSQSLTISITNISLYGVTETTSTGSVVSSSGTISYTVIGPDGNALYSVEDFATSSVSSRHAPSIGFLGPSNNAVEMFVGEATALGIAESIIAPQRLANRLYGLQRCEFYNNTTATQFVRMSLEGVISIDTTDTTRMLGAVGDDNVAFFGTRHPLTGEIHTSFDPICYR